jgi:hypothetical protein
MAKAAPSILPCIPSSCAIASAACRNALEATVAKFEEALEQATPATIRRRIKKAKDLDLDFSSPEIITIEQVASAEDKAEK